MQKSALKSRWLLDQFWKCIRYAHYRLRTGRNHVFRVRFSIGFHQLRHPKAMGAAEVEAFLTYFANERTVAPSTHRQALSAILHLHKEVLNRGLPWHADVSTIMIYNHLLGSSAAGTPSTLGAPALPRQVAS